MNHALELRRTRGVTLVELLVSIAIIGIALAGILVVIVRNAETSADPMLWHQSVAIAEAYVEEIMAKNFVANGVEPQRRNFDDIWDYNGLNEAPTDQNGTAVGALAGYAVNVAVVAAALNGIANAALITVTVTSPAGGDVTISGYRTNYF